MLPARPAKMPIDGWKIVPPILRIAPKIRNCSKTDSSALQLDSYGFCERNTARLVCAFAVVALLRGIGPIQPLSNAAGRDAEAAEE